MNKPDNLQSRKRTIAAIVTALAWILGSVASVVLIPAILDMILRIYAAFWGEYAFYGQDYWSAVFIRQILAMIFGMLCMALIVGSAEYYSRNYGTPKAWTVIARILAVEAALVTLTAII